MEVTQFERELKTMTGLWLVLFLWVASAQARVVTYPAPQGADLFDDAYQVWANDQPVAVYRQITAGPPFEEKHDHGGPYGYAILDTDGPVTVRVRSKFPLKDAVLRPLHDQFQSTLVDGELRIAFDGPAKCIVEHDGKRSPLMLFINPIETDIPDPKDEKVVYFGPGVHKPTRIKLESGQTLYLAGGAVVKGGVRAIGDDIRIRGRGILDGNDWEWRKGPGNLIAIEGQRVRVEGITIAGAWGWTIVPRHSSDVTIQNVKICNGRVYNDDGINPCNTQRMRIEDCFIRSDDDCVALKGLAYKDGVNNKVEDIVVRDCILWCDRARITLLGHESRAQYMRDIVFDDIDIPHYSMFTFLMEPGEDMRLENVTVKNVRINGSGQTGFIRLAPTVIKRYMKKHVAGHIRNATFENVELHGEPGKYLIQIWEYDKDHTTRGYRFDNFRINGKRVDQDYLSVKSINGH